MMGEMMNTRISWANWLMMAGVIAGLTACATVPDTITHKTPENKSKPHVMSSANGAIFQASAYRPLFEDRRARMVGDTLTVVINEKTTAAKAGAGSASHAGSVDYSASKILGLSSSKTDKLGLSTKSENKLEDKGAASSSNNFNGTIGVTVIDVQPNGNLLVKGEKQIALDRNAEFIRISGVVDPRYILAGNMVNSSQVSDVRVEYRTNTRVDQADVMSQFARFFLSMMPL